MNVSLKEFQRLVSDRSGTPYIFINDDGARLSYQIDATEIESMQFCHLVTSLNRSRTFKSVSSLYRFLNEYFPQVFFKTLVS